MACLNATKHLLASRQNKFYVALVELNRGNALARKHYNLPPLTTLTVFEAAARHASFKLAARELNVTPGAVSHQIKALEGDLNVQLFERQHRSVQLTPHGIELFTVLENSFRRLSVTLSRLRQSGANKSVTIAATTAVSSLWLTPRLSTFWKEFGGISINQFVSDAPEAPGANADLQIRYGEFEGDLTCRQPLFHDELVPVCSPSIAAQSNDTRLTSLARMPLIHLHAKEENWTTWHTWFKALGYNGDISEGQHVNSYMIALQAACDDVGVVLGWKQLVKPLIDSGGLVALSDYMLPAPAAFYLVWEPEEFLSENARTLRDWLLSNL